MPRTVTFQAVVVLMLWCVVGALMADAWATPLERVEFESASQRLISGGLIAGDRIQGYLAKPDGAGPFPAVVGLHGCAGMHDTTKQRLADELVARGYVILLVDSYATRGIDHACNIERFCHLPDAQAGCLRGSRLLGAPNLRRSTPCSCGRLLGWRLGYPLGGGDQFVRAVHPCKHLAVPGGGCILSSLQAGRGASGNTTLIFTGALDAWTPAADCSNKIAGWGNDGPPIELVVYPGAHHSFYYPHLQPGTTMFGHWLEYNGEAADNARHRLHQFLDRHLK